jgi:transcriptional regulator with XRE-family HTH domain
MTDFELAIDQMNDVIETLWGLRNQAHLSEDWEAETTYLDAHDAVLLALRELVVETPRPESPESDENVEVFSSPDEALTLADRLGEAMGPMLVTELAEKSEVSVQAIERILNGLTKHPQTKTIAKLEQALGVSLDG